MSDNLTQEQIENWRQILLGMIGPYALLMSDEQIQECRNAFLERFVASWRKVS